MAHQQAWLDLLSFTLKEFSLSSSLLGPATVAHLQQITAPLPLDLDTNTPVPLANSINAIANPQLRQTLTQLTPHMPWITQGFFTSGDGPIDRAYVELVGPDGLIFHEQFRYGLYWQQAHSLYPSHRHNALELYYILSGTALWQRGQEGYIPQHTGNSFDHLDRLDHATQTESEDLLTLWAWHGDLGLESYSMDA